MTELTFENTFSKRMPATVFPALYAELKTAASLECPEQPNGFLSYQTIYTDQEYERLFTVDGILPARPAIPTPLVLAAEATTAQREVYKIRMETYATYCTADSRLKRALIKAIGSSAQIAIGDPQHGLQRMTLRQIVQALFNLYGILTPPEIDSLLTQIAAPFSSTYFLDEESSSRQRMYAMLADAYQPIPEYLKVQHFMHSVVNLPGANDLTRQYLLTHPDTIQRTYASISNYFKRHLTPPLTTSAAGYAGSVSVVQSPELAPNVQTWLESRIAAAVASVSIPAPKPKGKGQIKATSQYCFVHGYQNSHSGRDCRVMASQPEAYSAAARHARSHDQIGIPANASTNRR